MVGARTAFPNGITNFGIPVFGSGGGGQIPTTFGKAIFVDSGSGSDSASGEDPDSPMATIDAAFGRVTASQGDLIIVKPGHTETLTAAAGIVADVAGVRVIGLGDGAQRPTIGFSTADTADIDIAAADVVFDNFIFDLTGIDALAAPIDVNAAGFQLLNSDVLLADGTGQAVLAILTDANADRLRVENNVFYGSSDAGPASAIRLVGCDRPIIRNNQFWGDFSAACIEVLTTAITRALIEGNDLENYNAVDVCIEGLAASTGTIRYNTCRVATDGQTTAINTPGNMQLYENYLVNNNGETGILAGTPSV